MRTPKSKTYSGLDTNQKSMTILRRLKRRFISFVVAVCLVATIALVYQVAKIWDSKEGILLNVIRILNFPMAPPLETVLGRTLKEQIEVLDNFTKDSEEKEIPELLARAVFNKEIASASFGETKTEIARIFLPSREKYRTIPALCTHPNNVEYGAALPLVIHFHGGGLIYGTSKMELFLVRHLAKATSAIVCSIDYRKAPEYPYPAAIDDALDAALFLTCDSGALLLASLGVVADTSKVATFGMGAGGYLAAQTARLLALEGVPLKLQVSIAPMVKPHGGTQSLLRCGGHDWNLLLNSYAWTVYLPGDDGELANDWTVNLLVDPPGEHIIKRLPPAYIQLGTRDVLYDEGKMYAYRLASQHKLLDVVEYDSTHIGSFPPFTRGGAADGAFDRAIEVLKLQFYDDDSTTTLLPTASPIPMNDASRQSNDTCGLNIGYFELGVAAF